MGTEIHRWVRELDHSVGWGLQAFSLPTDTDPAASIIAGGLRLRIASSPA